MFLKKAAYIVPKIIVYDNSPLEFSKYRLYGTDRQTALPISKGGES